MEKQELDERIAESSKTIFSYCLARTASQYDAEDLAQDIVVEIYRSAANIRDDKAFYGFMWAVAGNVYKQWCRKRSQAQNFISHEGLLEENPLPDSGAEAAFDAVLGEDSDIRLLRRELALLSEKFRRATILYYLEDKSCSQIADILSVSESMVKYLLFKSRKIVRKGMSMERNYGEQSYNPRKFSFHFWGDVNHYGEVCADMLAQNVLFACFNDRLSAEQISLEIGVGLPYLEDVLKKLCEYGLLGNEGGKYYGNLVIFTREFGVEAGQKTLRLREELVRKVKQAVQEKEDAIRSIGFMGADMQSNTYRWQMICVLLRYAVMEKFEKRIQPEYPVDVFGSHCFRWGEEESGGDVSEADRIWDGFGNAASGNGRGDIKFMDFRVNSEPVHHYFFGSNREVHTNIFIDIAAGRQEQFSDNDRLVAAEMVKRGWVVQEKGRLAVNAPVFTEGQMAELKRILDEPAEEIAAECEEMMAEIAGVLQNHVPLHLKKQAKQMPYFRVFTDAITETVRSLYREGFLQPARDGEMLPTTHVVLKEE